MRGVFLVTHKFGSFLPPSTSSVAFCLPFRVELSAVLLKSAAEITAIVVVAKLGRSVVVASYEFSCIRFANT